MLTGLELAEIDLHMASFLNFTKLIKDVSFSLRVLNHKLNNLIIKHFTNLPRYNILKDKSFLSPI